MHPHCESPLAQAFIEDHQKVTRALVGLRDAVERGTLAEASARAQELDRVAGPHMEFEEKVFYPQVARMLGAEDTAMLYAEHHEGQEVVKALLGKEAAEPFSDGERTRLLRGLQTAFEHVLSCGTLVSHVTTLDAQDQARLLERLLAFRERGRRWSELPHRELPTATATRGE